MSKSKSKLTPTVKTQKPVSVLYKPVKADFKDLFKALAKGIGHTATGKWVELGADAVEALSALGLTTEPGELAFLLIRRSSTLALFELVGDSASQFPVAASSRGEAIVAGLDFTIEENESIVDTKFLDRPAESSVVGAVQALLEEWLKKLGLENPSAKAIASRLPAYFVYALNQEWRRNAKAYSPLLDALDTPFTKAGEREWAWAEYAALLQRRIEEPVFDEPFSLSQIFVSLSAFYQTDVFRSDVEVERLGLEEQKRRAVVTLLEDELSHWLDSRDPQDVIRVISGGPGSGKSSFARVFAARISQTYPNLRVLFVPLHLMDASKDLVDEVGRFVRDEGVLPGNPLDPDSPESNLLIIFDGLDELASQGKAAAEVARAFVREVEKTVERRNQQAVRLRILLSGRELVVQENESEFRRPRQILNLLPYYTSLSGEYKEDVIVHEGTEYKDATRLLQRDLRQDWWRNYGTITGKGFKDLPKELARADLDEITAQPLLNYLVALSFTREKLDFTKDINLNSIYADLVAAVHERGYEKHRAYGPIRHMSLDNFSRVLEEIGLAAWHGDGRKTTVREIEEHCKTSGVGGMLDAFQEGAKAGVTRLLAAFFFRQYGQTLAGDPTFVFTHKSFGEYLAGRRVVRAIERISRELENRANSPDEGWDERDALKHWAQICGPSALSRYLRNFLLNETRLRSYVQLKGWHAGLSQLFNFTLRHGMPIEQLPIATFKEAMIQSRNAEEALLVALNVCAQITELNAVIEQPDRTSFGTWLKRIQKQMGGDTTLVRSSLSFLTLQHAHLAISDLPWATITSSNWDGLNATLGCLFSADLSNASLKSATLLLANLHGAKLAKANLEGARLTDVDAGFANFSEAILSDSSLNGANLEGADFTGANLERATLKNANLEGANLKHANLKGADLTGANVLRANFEGANLEGVRLDDQVAEQIRAFQSSQAK
jgi:uncharacterized protein YjbI with pentapeptide repeats